MTPTGLPEELATLAEQWPFDWSSPDRATVRAPNSAAGEELFNRLALRLFELQYRHNPPYRRWCDARGVLPGRIDHWSRIPAVITSAFREFDFTCLAPGHRPRVFHSSGTTGRQPSRHFHDALTLQVYETALWRSFTKALLPDDPGGQTMELLILMPPVEQAPHSSLVHMADTIRRRMRRGPEVFLATADSGGAWRLDASLCWRRLCAATETGRPVLILATAFGLVQLLDTPGLAPRNLALPTGSRIMETGGYKGRSRELSPAALRQLVHERLGVPTEAVISEYGMCELSSQAYDSLYAPAPGTARAPAFGQQQSGNSESRIASLRVRRRFRFPPWVRTQVIDPETGDPCPSGRPGLLRVFDLANIGSVLAIQTEDLAEPVQDGFVLLGRAPGVEPRGCSLLISDRPSEPTLPIPGP